jgi:hypothetical protein
LIESAEFYAVSDEIHRGSSLSKGECHRFVSAEDGVLNEFEMMWQLRILFPLHFVVFKQTTCHLTVEANVEWQEFCKQKRLFQHSRHPRPLGPGLGHRWMKYTEEKLGVE